MGSARIYIYIHFFFRRIVTFIFLIYVQDFRGGVFFLTLIIAGPDTIFVTKKFWQKKKMKMTKKFPHIRCRLH